MAATVGYQRTGSVATITVDDGRMNVVSIGMLSELNAALDQAAADGAVVVLAGRTGVFSAGFDLPVLRGGGFASYTLVRGGFETAERLLSFPTPVVAACTGHAIAMGAFLLLSADYRVGAHGGYTIAANEVAIGLTVPRAAVEIMRQRLAPAAFHRAVTLAEPFDPEAAQQAGFLDRLVAAHDLPDAALEVAERMTGLDMAAHRASKLSASGGALAAVRAAIIDDTAAFRARTA